MLNLKIIYDKRILTFLLFKFDLLVTYLINMKTIIAVVVLDHSSHHTFMLMNFKSGILLLHNEIRAIISIFL